MMRKTISACMAALILAACAKEFTQEPSLDFNPASKVMTAKAGEQVQITVTLPEVEALHTRVALSDNFSGGFKALWESGDEILVSGNVFTLVSSDGARGVFSGLMPVGETYDIVYPAVAEDAALVQKADNDFTHLKYGVSVLGVDSVEDVHMGHAWAGEHGGRFVQSGCLKLVLNLPAGTSSVTEVELSGEGIQTLSLSVQDGTLSDGSFTAYIPAGKIELDRTKKVTVTVKTAAQEILTNSYFPGSQTLYEGYVVSLVTSAQKWQRELGGKGSEREPYLVATADDMNNIRNLLTLNTYTYFKMTADIDFSSISGWQPLNLVNEPYGIMFDGDGHKITGFKCTNGTWASLFGVLHGEVKNLTLEDASITTTTTSPCGIVAAWVGNIDCTLQGRLENVKVVRGKVSASGATIIGGMAGRSGAGTFVNCSYDGVVERTSTAAYTSTYNPAGGILGEALNDVSFSGCSTSGSLTTNSGRACGGILGQCSKSLDITGCSSTMTITARDDVAGGIVGYYGSGTISGCTVASNITVREAGSGSSYMGGIAGHAAGTATITGCTYKGALNAKSGVVGGILGQSNASADLTSGCTITKCFSSGTITAKDVIGGVLGRSTDCGLNVSDCGSMMNVTGSSNYVGGFVGDLPKKSVVRNCFSSGTVAGGFAVGGFAGRAFGRQGSSSSLDADVNTTVENCIAYNPSVKTVVSGGEDPASHYSGGAVIGCSSRPNTLKNCWRKSDMVFDYYNTASLNVLFDHADSSPSSPLVQPSGSAKWYSPYHGKAAPSGATLSSVAQSAGWSSSIWDFSAAVPALKK